MWNKNFIIEIQRIHKKHILNNCRTKHMQRNRSMFFLNWYIFLVFINETRKLYIKQFLIIHILEIYQATNLRNCLGSVLQLTIYWNICKLLITFFEAGLDNLFTILWLIFRSLRKNNFKSFKLKSLEDLED